MRFITSPTFPSFQGVILSSVRVRLRFRVYVVTFITSVQLLSYMIVYIDVAAHILPLLLDCDFAHPGHRPFSQGVYSKDNSLIIPSLVRNCMNSCDKYLYAVVIPVRSSLIECPMAFSISYFIIFKSVLYVRSFYFIFIFYFLNTSTSTYRGCSVVNENCKILRLSIKYVIYIN